MTVSVHIDPETRHARLSCTLCPSWSPEFDDEALAWEVGDRHHQMAHGGPASVELSPTTTVDVVFTVRVGLVDDPSTTARLTWLTETLGAVLHSVTESTRVRDHIGLTFSQQFVFTKPLPPERLDLSASVEEIESLLRHWNQESE